LAVTVVVATAYGGETGYAPARGPKKAINATTRIGGNHAAVRRFLRANMRETYGS
jgi:hypothetical protein